MKKILGVLLSGITVTSFAANAVDVTKLECHCEKHHMIFAVTDGEKVSEMAKHCMLNEDKKNTMVKFFDDNSKQTVKCAVVDDKIQLKSCKEFDVSQSVKRTASK